MAQARYEIERFYGIDQSVGENRLDPSCSPDACNMNTEDGNLSVAKGYVKHVLQPVPGNETIKRCFVYRAKGNDMYLALTEGHMYASVGGIWLECYTFPEGMTYEGFDIVEATINGEDYIIIGTGETQLIKFNGTELTNFGSAEGGSDKHVRYIAMYMNRLFAAGDPEYPNRLYWSQLPGDDRTIENWGPYEASANVEGGHVEVGQFNNDPITGIVSLSSQLLILKRNSVYRLYGDRPSNFTLEEVDAEMEPCAHTAIVHNADAAYFMTGAGMFVYDGVSVYKAGDADRIKRIILKSDTTYCRGAKTRDKLYFGVNMGTAQTGYADSIIEYDMRRGVYMLRRGFTIADMFTRNNRLYIVDANRYVCLFDEGDSYDGVPIEGYWCIPRTDMGKKSVIKRLSELYVRGDKGGALTVEAEADGSKYERRILLLGDTVTEAPLRGEGRGFRLKFSNRPGERFILRDGIELKLIVRERSV